MQRDEELAMLHELIRGTVSPRALELAQGRIAEIIKLIRDNAPEEPGPMAGFWRVRLELDSMKMQIVRLIETHSHREVIQNLVNEAVERFDFKGAIGRAVNDHLKSEIDIATRRAISEACSQERVTHRIRETLVDALAKVRDE